MTGYLQESQGGSQRKAVTIPAVQGMKGQPVFAGAVRSYVGAVKAGAFPEPEHCF